MFDLCNNAVLFNDSLAASYQHFQVKSIYLELVGGKI